MAITKWATAEAIATALSTELNSLANITMSAASAVIAGSTDKRIYMLCQIDVTFAIAPTAGARLDVFMLMAPDGTNFATSHVDYAANLIQSFFMKAVTTQQIVSTHGIVLPPTDFKLAIYNSTGQSFPASGSTLKYQRYSPETL